MAPEEDDHDVTVAVDERPSRTVRNGEAEIKVFVHGSSPSAVVILPSYGRDGADDYDAFTARLVEAGGGAYLVLRPQPRGILGSTGPMHDVDLHDMAADIAHVIEQLAPSGRAVLIGHAFGNFIARVIAVDYPDKVAGVVLAAAQGTKVPEEIARAPMIAANLKGDVPEAERLAALRLAFFAKNHDPRIWLSGWYRDTLKMQVAAVHAPGVKLSDFWGGGRAQLLEIIADQDPFKSRDQWEEMRTLFPDRTTTIVIDDAGHALFPEQCEAVVQAVLPWLAKQTAEMSR